MKKIVFIQARMNATRLPGKVLKTIDGTPLLLLQIERVCRAQLVDQVVVLTTGRPEDDAIANLCRDHGIRCCRGSERDVLDRYYRGALSVQADVVIRLTADCPLIDPLVIDQVVGKFLEGGYDYVANTAPPPGTFPDGQDVEVFSFAALEKAWREAVKFSDREHVTFYMWKNPDKFKTSRVNAAADNSAYRLTIDYPEDFILVKKLRARLKQKNQFGHLPELLAIIDQEPGLKRLNKGYQFGAGWKPSLRKDKTMAGAKALPAPPLKLSRGNAAWKKAIRIVPGGAQTFSKGPRQYVDGVAPKMLCRGIGCRVWDLDGNEFIDYVLGLGPAILGHSVAEVNAAAASCAAEAFNSPSLPHPLETRLSEKLRSLIPCAEMVRFGKNGSDATAGAVRLARALTGRDVIGCCGYHGWQDWYIGSTTRHRGVPQAVRDLTVTFNYNDIASVEKIFREHKNNVAALILEPVNFFPPKNGFLKKLRALCDRHKTLLIFDEVITGFRMHLGGAQTVFGVTPDLATFGKAMANGFPISAICGKAKYMREFENAFFSFTFGGELPTMAAALATIDILEREQVPRHINRMGEQFIRGFNQNLKELDISFCRVFGYGWWPEYEFSAANGFTALEILTLMQQEVVKRGVLTRPAPFISFSHKEPDIRETLLAMKQAMAVVKEGVSSRKLKKMLEGKVIQPVIRAKPE